ncbi:MAG: hypothetical protein ACON5H_00090 [Akkermansiaceae bacterium]
MKTLSAILLFVFATLLHAQDPGKEKIGSLSVEMIYATDGGLEKIGSHGKELAKGDVNAIRKIKKLSFKNYRSMGVEVPQILRSYESWATPMRPSKEMLISFEPLSREGANKLQMVLEYWQSKRKLFSTNPVLVKGKPLYLLGPEWRGGKVILKLKLLELTE